METKTFFSSEYPNPKEFDAAVGEYASEKEDEGYDVEITTAYHVVPIMKPTQTCLVDTQKAAATLELIQLVCKVVNSYVDGDDFVSPKHDIPQPATKE